RDVQPHPGDRVPPRNDRYAGRGVRARADPRPTARMSFLSPLAFALTALVLPLVLLYFLKVRRRERRVPSLLLWDPSLPDREASAFFQRLQRDPLLNPQILALLPLAVARARPGVT